MKGEENMGSGSGPMTSVPELDNETRFCWVGVEVELGV